MNIDAAAAGAQTGYNLRSRFPSVSESDLGEIVRNYDRMSFVPSSSKTAVETLGIPQASEATAKRFERCLAATALVVRTHALIPCPAGFWLEALPSAAGSDAVERLPSIAGGIGTAFLVTPQHMVTAAHAIDEYWIGSSAFVFDLHAGCLRQPEDDLPLRYEVPAYNVAFGSTVSEHTTARRSDDIAIVTLKEPTSRLGVVIANLNRLVAHQEVAMIGCARMQPLTIVAQTEQGPAPFVHSFTEDIIRTNVDSFQGNSGSPLLDAQGHVLGVHVGITGDGRDNGSKSSPDGSGVAVASAVRVRVIGDRLAKIGAAILT
ncbi:MAG TPA: serine protease [Tahibacter sp.]|uniref:trypsin-like serine peptidase n=1 Tax=Tahibacter sp. TaxID=2056211 RepID=UPI002D0BD5F6|nr:serine protease [Tahibacter sp.]HSX59002.1 serine protease [Tahibacter sp.]